MRGDHVRDLTVQAAVAPGRESSSEGQLVVGTEVLLGVCISYGKLLGLHRLRYRPDPLPRRALSTKVPSSTFIATPSE